MKSARIVPAEPLARLVRFEATDKAILSGLLYEPRRRTRRVAIFLHGTGGASVYDSSRTNRLANELIGRGVAWFPFNNRGAHLMRRVRVHAPKKRSIGGGMAWELIRESIHDIDGAARMLRARGYRELYLIGHSTGANKIALYDFYRKRNPYRKYILLAGGDDVGLTMQQMGVRRFRAALKRGRALRRSEDLVPKSISKLPMSWRSLYDMINPEGDYNVFPFLEVMTGRRLSRKPRFRHVRGIRKPTLAIYGERDEYCFGDVPRCVEILADAVGPKPNFEFVIMKDADHGFGGHEEELGALMADWLLES